MSNPAPIIPINPSAPDPAIQSPEQLVARRASLKADAEYIADQIQQLDAQLLDILGGEVGTHDVAGTKVQVRQYSRLDTAWIEREYPAAQYPQLYKTTTAVDTAAVKKEFAPAVLDEHQVRGAKSLVIP